MNFKVLHVQKINKFALPLINDNKRWIEYQTKHWIKNRRAHKECYAVLEKDKIIIIK